MHGLCTLSLGQLQQFHTACFVNMECAQVAAHVVHDLQLVWPSYTASVSTDKASLIYCKSINSVTGTCRIFVKSKKS
jgi:hypothetical protein